MEVKKSPKADLEGKKLTGTLIGLVLILAAVFVGFEWNKYDKQFTTDSGVSDPIFEEEIIPITEQKEPEQAPPPPEAPKVEEIIQIAQNDANVEESTIQSTEETKTAVEIKYQAPVVAAPVKEEESDEMEIFQVVENMPEYPGGQAALMKFLASNIKYPQISQENGTQGRVIVRFVIEKDGSVADPVVMKSIDPYLDKEALRVVKSLPKWKPGMQRNKPVRVSYTLPVTFRLQ